MFDFVTDMLRRLVRDSILEASAGQRLARGLRYAIRAVYVLALLAAAGLCGYLAAVSDGAPAQRLLIAAVAAFALWKLVMYIGRIVRGK